MSYWRRREERNAVSCEASFLFASIPSYAVKNNANVEVPRAFFSSENRHDSFFFKHFCKKLTLNRKICIYKGGGSLLAQSRTATNAKATSRKNDRGIEARRIYSYLLGYMFLGFDVSVDALLAPPTWHLLS